MFSLPSCAQFVVDGLPSVRIRDSFGQLFAAVVGGKPADWEGALNVAVEQGVPAERLKQNLTYMLHGAIGTASNERCTGLVEDAWRRIPLSDNASEHAIFRGWVATQQRASEAV